MIKLTDLTVCGSQELNFMSFNSELQSKEMEGYFSFFFSFIKFLLNPKILLISLPHQLLSLPTPWFLSFFSCHRAHYASMFESVSFQRYLAFPPPKINSPSFSYLSMSTINHETPIFTQKTIKTNDSVFF